MDLTAPLACAREEILRLRDLCREAHWALHGLHDRGSCPAAAALRRLEMAGGMEPPR